jgi:hypothetical protein
MKAIRYGIHFTSLAVASIIFWVVRDFRLPLWISNFNFFHYALMGALHANVYRRFAEGPEDILRTGFYHTRGGLERIYTLYGVDRVRDVGSVR